MQSYDDDGVAYMYFTSSYTQMLALTVAGPKVVGAGVILVVRVSLITVCDTGRGRSRIRGHGRGRDVDEGEEGGEDNAGVGLEVEVVLAESWKQSP